MSKMQQNPQQQRPFQKQEQGKRGDLGKKPQQQEPQRKPEQQQRFEERSNKF